MKNDFNPAAIPTSLLKPAYSALLDCYSVIAVKVNSVILIHIPQWLNWADMRPEPIVRPRPVKYVRRHGIPS